MRRGIVQEYLPLFLSDLLKKSYLVSILRDRLSTFRKNYIPRELKAQRNAEGQIDDREFDKFATSFKILNFSSATFIIEDKTCWFTGPLYKSCTSLSSIKR